MQYEAEIKMFKKTLSEIGTDKNKCPVCLHEISSEDKVAELKKVVLPVLVLPINPSLIGM